MSKQVISEIANRDSFFTLLQHNPGLIVIKLGAEWCGPCKVVKPAIHGFFASSPPEVVCADIDVDKSFDFYSFLKSKKMRLFLCICIFLYKPLLPKNYLPCWFYMRLTL